MENHDSRRIYAILQKVLRVPIEKLSEETGRRNLEEWDSLSHMMLIEALGKEFGLTIPAESALAMETVQDIKRIITDLRQ